MAGQVQRRSNHAKQGNQIEVLTIYDCRIVSCFISLRLKDLNLSFRYRFKLLSHARQSFTILTHLNSYMRSIKGVLMKTYQIDSDILKMLLSILIELGYIKTSSTKVRSNLGYICVKRVAYMITPLGREVLNDLNDLLLGKLSKLK